ncbi:MAG: hypothetical protein QF921_09990 [Pseudomonadales bacterium]|jgi:hypothetical protein|nr:hypothetical protein [Pseudomonadales bacterium]MDP6472331.1 hypothetical protein [Pseudomonadales bacterium]MDP6828127.1 hypothetical protein [Pseudomonadales bacterium]MDP6971825.1 hypothetical protein [Pseudomonadales bacterium]|tara:strand:+ start:2347 stop:2757 length:411 start_codon:yes stop_codon:yes gene_type:complete
MCRRLDSGSTQQLRIVPARLVVYALVMFSYGCVSGPPVTVDYDENHDFRGYQNFIFVSESPLLVGAMAPVNRQFTERLMRVAGKQLEQQGCRFEVHRDVADFAIGFALGLSSGVRENSYPNQLGDVRSGWVWGGLR